MGRLLACAALACFMVGCGTNFDLGWNDAGVPYDAECKPGTYTGSCLCMSTSTASALPSGVPGVGTITITLVPAGGAHTLALAPGAMLSTTNSGTTVTEALNGVLDCATRKLTGTADQVMIRSSSFDETINGMGTLDAVYNVDSGRPKLDDGTLFPPSPVATKCTWSATLQ